MKFLLFLFSVIVTLCISIAASSLVFAASSEHDLCNDPATEIFKYSASNKVYGSAALYTPKGEKTTIGTATSVIFPATVNLEGRVVSLGAFNGVTDWTYLLNNPVMTSTLSSTSVKGAEGSNSIYFGSDDGRLYSVNAETGNRNFFVESGGDVQASPLIWNDFETGQFFIYFGSTDMQMHAAKIEPTGDVTSATTVWSVPTGDVIFGTPCIVNHFITHLLVFGSTDGTVYGVEPKTGRSIFNYTAGASVSGSCTAAPVNINNIGRDAIFIGDDDGVLHAISPTGTSYWTFATGDAIVGAPAIGQIVVNGHTDDIVVVGSADNFVYCIWVNNGTLAWKYQTNGKVSAAPILSTGKKNYQSSTISGLEFYSSPMNVLFQTAQYVYVASRDGNLTQLDATTGAWRWNYTASGAIEATPTLDHSTGIMYFGSLDQTFYAVLAEPSCLPSCNIIPPNNLENRDIKSDKVVFAKKTIKEVSAHENKNGRSTEPMPNVDGWHSAVQSVMFHNNDYDEREIVNGKIISEPVAKSDSYLFLPLEQIIDWSTPVQKASGNNNLVSSTVCSIDKGCEDVLPCIYPRLKNAQFPTATNYSKEDYCRYWNEAGLYALFEYAVALVTTTNVTFARAVFNTRRATLLATANQNKTCFQTFGAANIIADEGASGFICNPTSVSPHFVLSASYLSDNPGEPNNGEYATYSFDATAYAQLVDAVETFNAQGAIVSTRAADLLGGAQTFISSCACSSCAPYVTADNIAVPWLFLICASIKAVIVYFKFVPWISKFKRAFLRNRTGAAAELTPEERDGTKTLKDGTKVKARGYNDVVANFKKAQYAKDEQRRLNAATFYNSAEVQRRLQLCLNTHNVEGQDQQQQQNENNDDLLVGRDFVKFYLTQFSAPSTSFEASSITNSLDREARKEKVVDVVVPDVINHAKEVASILAPLDKVFENLVEIRNSQGGAAGISLRESQGFSGYMSSFLRFSSTAASRTAGYGDTNTKDHKQSKNALLRSSEAYGYGAAGDNVDEQEVKTKESFKYDYNKNEQDEQQAGSGDNTNNNEVPAASSSARGSTASGVGESNKKAKQLYYAEVRSALKAFKKAQQEHPEWFELITVVIHRAPKNPFLPSRLILALATLYAVIYYIVSLVDAFKWFDAEKTILASEDSAHPGAATNSDTWLRYEAFAWRIMNSTIFPILFVNCIFANWQYTEWTKSDASAISSRVNPSENSSKQNSSGHVDMGEDVSDDEEDLSRCERFTRFVKTLSQHFEGRVAIASFIMMLPMLLTHCLPAMFIYIWLVAPLGFFFVFTPCLAISHYTALLRFELVERQYFNLNRSLKTNAALAETDQAPVPSTIYNDDVDNVKCLACASTQSGRRRTIVYLCYCLVFFFVCVLASWSFNIALLYIYDANGSVHAGDGGNGGNRYTSAIGWEFESRSPVCGVITFWMSPTATMRNAAVGFTPF